MIVAGYRRGKLWQKPEGYYGLLRSRLLLLVNSKAEKGQDRHTGDEAQAHLVEGWLVRQPGYEFHVSPPQSLRVDARDIARLRGDDSPCFAGAATRSPDTSAGAG